MYGFALCLACTQTFNHISRNIEHTLPSRTHLTLLCHGPTGRANPVHRLAPEAPAPPGEAAGREGDPWNYLPLGLAGFYSTFLNNKISFDLSAPCCSFKVLLFQISKLSWNQSKESNSSIDTQRRFVLWGLHANER